MADLAKLKVKYYPVSLILKEDYDNILYLEDYDNRLMIIHGTEDVRIPIRFSKKLFESVPSNKKEYIGIKNAEHGNIMDYEETISSIKRFIEG